MAKVAKILHPNNAKIAGKPWLSRHSALFSTHYLGTISVRLHRRKYNQAGYVITMYDSGNLRLSYDAYKQSHPQQSEEDFRVLERFLDAYGACYDRERNALVYTTKHSARIVDALEGETELRNRIALHPLAELDSLSQIHTKYIGRI